MAGGGAGWDWIIRECCVVSDAACGGGLLGQGAGHYGRRAGISQRAADQVWAGLCSCSRLAFTAGFKLVRRWGGISDRGIWYGPWLMIPWVLLAWQFSAADGTTEGDSQGRRRSHGRGKGPRPHFRLDFCRWRAWLASAIGRVKAISLLRRGQ